MLRVWDPWCILWKWLGFYLVFFLTISSFIYLFFIYNIRRIARLFPTVHYALNLRDAARNELERNMERRYDFRCRRKPKCSEKTCAGKYGSRTKFTYDSDPTGNRTRAALVKGTGTTAAPTCPPMNGIIHNLSISRFLKKIILSFVLKKASIDIVQDWKTTLDHLVL